MDDDVVSRKIIELGKESWQESETIKIIMASVVPTYKPSFASGCVAGGTSVNNATANHPAGTLPENGKLRE